MAIERQLGGELVLGDLFNIHEILKVFKKNKIDVVSLNFTAYAYVGR